MFFVEFVLVVMQVVQGRAFVVSLIHIVLYGTYEVFSYQGQWAGAGETLIASEGGAVADGEAPRWWQSLLR